MTGASAIQCQYPFDAYQVNSVGYAADVRYATFCRALSVASLLLAASCQHARGPASHALEDAPAAEMSDAEMPPPPACSETTRPDACDFYDCFENKFQCGPTGYPVAYGKHYCEKFKGGCDDKLTSESAKKWIRGTTLCLQRALVESQDKLSECAEVRKTAFDSHPYCYTNGAAKNGGISFCSLLPTEWARVRHCIAASDELSILGVKQIASTAIRCSGFFGHSFGLQGEENAQPDADTARLIASLSPAEREARAQAFADLAAEIEGELLQTPPNR